MATNTDPENAGNGNPAGSALCTPESSCSSRGQGQEDDDEEVDAEGARRLRSVSLGPLEFLEFASEVGQDDFDASVELEQLEYEIGLGGGYGDRTIFDMALVEVRCRCTAVSAGNGMPAVVSSVLTALLGFAKN